MNTAPTIGIIMDGNRRWAKQHGLPSIEGHRRGYEKFTEFLSWAKEAEVTHVVAYALSTENLKRSREEVAYLLDLFREVVKERLKKADEEGVRVICAGARDLLSRDLVALIEKLEEKTQRHTQRTLVIAAPYGGRAELVAAANRAIAASVPVDEETFRESLWAGAVPDIDLLIRTGGERRLSNFLPWQSAYAELFFVDTLWPDFSRETFRDIVKEYGERQRRFGA